MTIHDLTMVALSLLGESDWTIAQVSAPALAQAGDQATSTLQLLGAGAFGVLIGWYVYMVNRYRKGDVQLGDLTTLIGIVGGGAVLALFPQGSDLFGAYGIGLGIGFFTYFLILIILVGISKNFDADWFLDGRRRLPDGKIYVPEFGAQSIRPMGDGGVDPTQPR